MSAKASKPNRQADEANELTDLVSELIEAAGPSFKNKLSPRLKAAADKFKSRGVGRKSGGT